MKPTTSLLTTILLGLLAVPVEATDTEGDFEYWYKQWDTSLSKAASFSSIMDLDARYYDNPFYQKILGLGVDAVPLILAKMKTDPRIGKALIDITKWCYHINRVGDGDQRVWTVDEFPDEIGTTGPPDGIRLCERWWTEFRKQVPVRFSALYAEWQGLKKEGKSKEAEEKLQRIKDLGIDVLPLLVERVQKGDTDLIPAIAYLTDKKMPESATAAECVSWWAANKEKWTLPPPTANEK
jgi:hypothetical protein